MLSKTLKKLRENIGYTQQQVADALSIDRSTYAYYETGKTNPDINTIIKLSKIFNVSYTDIFEQEEQCQNQKFSDVEDNRYFLTKESNHIYELSKREKALVGFYRVLPHEIQETIIKDLSIKVSSLSKKSFL
ncbi:MAG: hypothetical protein RUMPE_00502 [Eubacteriales bacterium SKADARSKE-1]|nr:hypothetical protein [Eubacteriales bacterium SKADARSKE-1]